MQLETDLNVEPYFDDFDESKNFHRILFRPRFPVQARELTQLQTILQNQIDRFGSHIFTQGSIIKGCSFYFIRDYFYAKILDLTVDGIGVDLDSYSDTYVVNATTGLKAILLESVTGLQSSANGELNTLYFKYLNAGTGGEITFANSDVLTIYARDYSVQQIDIDDGGASYTNGDAIVVTGGGGTGANGYIITDTTGEISEIVLSTGGTDYTTTPTANVTSNTGSGAALTVRNYIDKVTVANSSFTAPVGRGYAFRVSDGIIFQKGHFINVEEQSTIVSKYDTNPDELVVGFTVVESVVNNSVDSSLNDNAIGYPNYRAPGAYRLKLDPVLVTLTKAEAAANNEFFSLVEFENGAVVRQNQTANYNELGKELAKRTREESGDYTINRFKVTTESIDSNTTHINAVINNGVAYVDGYRVELINTTRAALPVADTYTTENSVAISLNYGNYILVKEMMGVFALNALTQVNLKGAAYTDVTDINNDNYLPDTGGTTIGTAYVKGVQYESGTPGTPSATYRVYLFNIAMGAGYSFDSVRAIQATDAAADLVLENGIAVIKEASFNSGIFPVGLRSIRSYANGTQYSFRHTTTGSLSSTGEVTIVLAGTEEFPYGVGALNATQKRDFIIVPTASARQANLGGTVSSSSNTVTGSGTSFTTDFTVGDYIQINTSAPRLIVSIANNTSLTMANTVGSVSANVYGRGFPNNTPISLEGSNVTVTIDSAQQATIDLNTNIHGGGTLAFKLYYNGRQDDFISVKAINKDCYVKISNTALATSSNNAWCLGVPDAMKLVAVYKTSNNTTYDEATDVTSHFALSSGQRDTHYGLSYIKKRSTSSLTVDGSTHLIVKFDAFTTTSTRGYYTVDSYPTSNTVPVEANKINWVSIPVYQSESGAVYDLRDCIDTRPYVSNTAAVTSTLGSATINPANTEAFSGTVYTPSPNQTLTADVGYFLPRRDKVVLDSFGKVRVLNGVSSIRPEYPSDIDGTMTLASLSVPAFPTIATLDKYIYNRNDHTITASIKQNKRYTMRDIEKLEDRIKQIEYYTSLTSLETDTKNLVLPSEANNSFERFKHGFIVDPLIDYSISATSSPEFKVFVDTNRAEATPTFEQGKFDVVANSFSDTIRRGNNIYLDFDDVMLITQPIATRSRIITQSYWRFNGSMTVNPAYDNFYSTTSKPIQVDMDYTEGLESIINSVNDAFKFIKVNESSDVQSTTFQNRANTFDQVESGTGRFTSVLNTSIEHLTTINTTTHKWDYLQLTPGVTTGKQTEVGSFVTNFTMSPFIRAQSIYFFASGLRPDTRHYVWFDEKDVDAYITPMKIHTAGSWSDDPTDYYESGIVGDALVADEYGTIAGKFDIPEGMFLVGDRTLNIFNVSDRASWDTAISKAAAKFNAFNFNVEKGNLSFNTGQTFASGVNVINAASTSTTERVDFDRATVISIQNVDNEDPLAQSFIISPEVARGNEGINLTKADLYFKEKDPTFGIVVEIRTVRLGIPTSEILARTRLRSDEVNTSNTAATATTVVFDTPVFLRAGEEYAICLLPEANSPEYVVWTGEAGGTDVASSLTKNQDWAYGAMFLSTNATTWTAVQGEDLKVSLYFAQFSVTSGTITLVNDDREFLSISNSSGSVTAGMPVGRFGNTYISGSFVTLTTNNIVTDANTAVSSQVTAGDYLLLIHDSGSVANLTGNVAVNATSNVIVGNGTSFDTDFAVNDYIYVNMDSAANVQVRRVTAVTNSISMQVTRPFAAAQTGVGFHKLDTDFDIVRVVNVALPSITLNKHPQFSSNTTNAVFAEKVIVGIIDGVDSTISTVVLKDSTANSTIYFANNDVLIANNNQTLTIGSVDDINISHFESLFNNIVYPGTSIAMSASFMNASNTLVSNSYAFGSTNYLPFDGKLRSRSNEHQYGFSAKSFNATITLASGSDYISPIFGASSPNILRYAYDINNDVTDEHLMSGNAHAKYLTKQVVLADGQESEDLKVYLTAYKPVGTEIYVYAKIMSESDSDNFNDKDWSLLEQVTSNSVFSSTSNKNDYREFEYTFAEQPYATQLSAGVTTNANTLINTPIDLSANVAAGDIIVLENSVTGDYEVRKVTSANSTVIAVVTDTTLNSTGTLIKLVTRQKTAYKNYEDDSGIVRYFNTSGAAYDGFKIFAIKIVLASDLYSLVPRVDDVRAIAVSV